MGKPANNTFNLALIIGVLGFICGLGLLFTENWFMFKFRSLSRK